MEQIIPMDRLVCGDVGYGKTEIAVRAAFKAVQDGKQVAVLVPTTLLVRNNCPDLLMACAHGFVDIDRFQARTPVPGDTWTTSSARSMAGDRRMDLR